MGNLRLDAVVRREDSALARIESRFGVPITLIARPDVSVEAEGIAELLEFVSIQDTLLSIWEEERKGRIAPFWGEGPGRLAAVVLTPDFHKGSGIPVGTVADARGFVVPRAVGNDVCCGMRLAVTDVTHDELVPHMAALKKRLRAIFFQGQRNIPMSPRQREALLRDGLWGLAETAADNQGTGIWQYYDPARELHDLERVHFNGALPTEDTFAFASFIRASGAKDGRDIQIGSVGGGNHFVELQRVDEIVDGHAAHTFGLGRGAVTIMAHSGSVGLGHVVGGHFMARAHELYPKGLPHPAHGFYVMPTWGPLAAEAAAYLSAMRNAANFAFGNRLFLVLMAARAMSEVLGRTVETRLVYDAPHNLIWEPEGRAGRFLHRKGATPAPGPDPFESPFQYTGHPVIIPGSMGDASWVLAGLGNEALLASACHGAGRSLTRGQASHVSDDVYRESTGKLDVVTPIDPDAPSLRGRRDILEKYHRRMKEEAPYAYKAITPVVRSVEDAGVARRVVRLAPIATVKG
ncbi:RtcB family protein [Polyangium jinanense]|uniref:tRNA-splicing ligase RtcB n=1 Tax=Polyangium jinanense TaxID=2829994 RepID=A0A9X3XDK9_9BACT|nr:RtcB family protein [Polyangium jinanense]MDC3988674.1 RtcB family protein [Polyangium jinanense]